MDKSSLQRSWLILVGLALGICVSNGFARFSYGLILPAMQQDLDWTYTQAGWINTANALGYVVGAVVTFLLVRRVPAPHLFSIGMVGTSVCLVANGLTADFWWLSLWRILTGVFGALVFIVGSTLAASLFQDDPKRNALAIAINFGGGGFGMVLSGVALPLLFAHSGNSVWPLSWLALGLASIVCCVFATWSAYAVRQPDEGNTVETAATHLPVRRMLAMLFGYGLFAAGYIVYLTFLIAWMQSLAFSSMMVAGVWLIVGLSMMASPFVWRPLLAHYMSGFPFAMAVGATSVGTLLPLIWPSAVGLIVSAALFGLSVFIAPSAVTSFSRKNLPSPLWGPALGLLTIVFALGQTVGPVAAGAVGDHFGDIRFGLLGAGVVLGLGAVIGLFQSPLVSQPTKAEARSG